MVVVFFVAYVAVRGSYEVFGVIAVVDFIGGCVDG